MVIVILPQKIGFSITACAPDQIQDTERMPVPIGVSFWGGPLLGVQKVKVFTQCSTLVDNVLSRQYVQVVLQCATRGFGPCRLTM